MIDNIIADAVGESYDGSVQKFLNNSQKNNSETVTNKNVKERYISSEERWKIIDNLDNIDINVIF